MPSRIIAEPEHYTKARQRLQRQKNKELKAIQAELDRRNNQPADQADDCAPFTHFTGPWGSYPQRWYANGRTS